LYRLQIGAYSVPRHAVEALEKLKNADLKPAYERYNDLYRVVLPGIRGSELPYITAKLGAGGFKEALIREE
jgi:rare lipoprotein A